MRFPRLLAVAVTLCTLPAIAAGLPVPLGDAGTGQDAGDSRAEALPLAYGAYEGNLTPGDADWYTFPASGQLGCADVTVLASSPMRFEVAVGGSSVGGLADEGAFQLTVASVGPTSFAALPDEDPWAALSVGPYSFGSVHTAAWGIGDTASADASNRVASAAPVPAECFEASFRHDAPDVDVWTFEANLLDVVTYSLAVGDGAVAHLEVLGPDGVPVDDPVPAGEAGQFVASATGTYAVRATSVTSWDQAPYVVGLVVGPDPSTCRPYCLGLA